MNNSWLTQWIPGVFIAICGVVTAMLTLARTRLRREEHQELQHSQQARVPPLNGYAAILRDALERIDWLRKEIDVLQSERELLLVRLDDCQEKRLHARGASAPRKAKTSTPVSTPIKAPRPSRSKRRNAAQ